MRLRALACGAMMALALSSPAWAADAAPQSATLRQRPITIGEELTIASSTLGEDRRIAVYLPADYAEGSKRYPVLYLIDGGVDQDFLHIAGTTQLNAIWGRSEPVIVVGIETVNRQSELTGPTHAPDLLKTYPKAGHSADFRRFIRDEVMPLITTRYRGNGQQGVIGESLAGLFIVETALREPGLFQRYAAISPSLWWDDESLPKAASGLLGKASPAIYLDIADEGGAMDQGYDQVVKALAANAPMGSHWCAVKHPALAHSTIYHAVSPQALQFLFPVEGKPVEGQEMPRECTTPEAAAG